MKPAKYYLILFLLIVSISHAVKADVAKPVKWTNTIDKLDQDTYLLKFKATIDPGWHLYGVNIPAGGPIATSFNFEESTSFAVTDAPTSSVEPQKKHDSTFDMKLELYDGSVTFSQKIKIKSSPALIKGFIEFMACDESRCLPPSEEYFDFNVGETLTSTPTQEAEADVKVESKPIFSPAENTVEKNEITANNDANDTILDSKSDIALGESENKIDAVIESKTESSSTKDAATPLWVIFFNAILGGLAAIITPCVYPIIPLTVSFFSSGSGSKRSTISKALSFGVSLIVIYASVGLISGIFQIDLMKVITSHWLPNLLFFILFIVFAASFFGAFEIMLPNRWANSIDQKADKGGVIGAFFMALATAVVSFSCTGLIAGVVLGYAMQGDIVTPVVGMAGFGLGFALPFTLLAFFPSVQKKLPKSGGWLNAVKVVFAFLMLLFSLVFLSLVGWEFITRDIVLSAAIAILLFLGLYLIGKIKFSHDSDLPFVSIPRILLAILSWTFAIYLVTGLFGAPLKKISPFLPADYTLGINLTQSSPSNVHETGNSGLCVDNPRWSESLHLPHGLKGYFDWNEALKCAKEQNKPVLIDFVGHSCKNCKKMYAEVWSDAAVLKRLKDDFIILALYTDDKTELPEEEWITSTLDGRIKKTIGKVNLDFQVSEYQSNALPMYVIVDPSGKILTTSLRYYTYSNDINAFVDFLDEGLSNFK